MCPKVSKWGWQNLHNKGTWVAVPQHWKCKGWNGGNWSKLGRKYESSSRHGNAQPVLLVMWWKEEANTVQTTLDEFF